MDRMPDSYVVAIVGFACTAVGVALDRIITWYMGRDASRADLERAYADTATAEAELRRVRAEEVTARTLQWQQLIDELVEARAREREEHKQTRDRLIRLERQSIEMQRKIDMLVTHVGQLEDLLREAGVNPPPLPQPVGD